MPNKINILGVTYQIMEVDVRKEKTDAEGIIHEIRRKP